MNESIHSLQDEEDVVDKQTDGSQNTTSKLKEKIDQVKAKSREILEQRYEDYKNYDFENDDKW
jgi:ElaB/YqjD/DUF883 family membrane-anchored ribosome-binding protein